MRASKTTACALLGLLAAVGVGGCLQTTQDRLNSWIGTTDALLIAAWGAPDREATAGGGLRVLTYLAVREDSEGRQYLCRRNFTVDDEHRVVAATYHCS